MSVRPLSALPPTLTRMGKAAQSASVETVKESTRRLSAIVAVNGSRYTLRGRGGRQVPLTAMSNIRAVGATPVGWVKGIPEGFWVIVEYGRGGGYLVASSQTRAGDSRKGGQRGLFKTFESGDSFGHLKPIRTPKGPRQYARPGPHGPIGSPWATAMAAGRPAVQANNNLNQWRALAAVWT